MAARLIIVLLLSAIGRALPAAVQVGPGLWQQGQDFVASLDMGYYSDLKINPVNKVSFHFYLPVLFAQEDGVFVPGQSLFYQDQSASHEMRFLRSPEYAAVLVQHLYWQYHQLKIGVINESNHSGTGLLLWGNPARNGRTPYLNSRFAIQSAEGGYFSSDTTRPSFHFAHYTFRPFTSSRSYFINELEFTPVTYIDFVEKGSPQHYGGGIEVKTGGFRQPDWAFGSLWSFSYGLRTETATTQGLYRADMGLWFSFWHFSMSGGFSNLSENHPHGPYLSDLYSGRSNLELGSPGASLWANFLSVSTNPENPFGLKAMGSIYYGPSSDLSVHVWAFYKDKDDEVRLGFIKEKIKIYRDFNRHHNSDAFIEFMLRSKLVQGAITLNWQTFLNWYNGSQARSKIWVSLLF